jgi:DNA/RNA-binding domain of Phe-tRNA-synthetase-like protein
MMEFILSEVWKADYPGAAAGILSLRGVCNPDYHPALDGKKEELEHELRSKYSGYDRSTLRELPTIQAYHHYYKPFKKTYHVQLQLESVVFKGKSIPRVAALVEAMFMAELKNLLLTAGHDADAIQAPLRIDVAEGSESYIRINHKEQKLKSSDMMIADSQGVISSVLYGPDHRTRITSTTQRVIFTVYAPPGIGEKGVDEHLQDIRSNVLILAPGAEVELLKVYRTE